MNVYYHWGRIGDILYSIPTINVLGRGDLILGMSQPRVDFMRSFLEAQPSIARVLHDPRGRMNQWTYRPPGVTHDLNAFRMLGMDFARHSLVALQAKPFKVKLESLWKPWLVVPEGWVAGKYSRAIVARSSRYHNPAMDWAKEIAMLRANFLEVAFIGIQSEHEEFCAEVGDVARIETPTLWDMARVIYESQSFTGNHSSPLAVAQGLGVKHRIEVAPGHWNVEHPENPNEERLCPT